jgi:hypothetical protein
MRILLDESLPRTLRAELLEHSVKTVVEMGWSGIKNGELLRRAADRFDVFVTADQNLPYQQNLSALPVSVVVLAARTNRIEALRPGLFVNGVAKRAETEARRGFSQVRDDADVLAVRRGDRTRKAPPGKRIGRCSSRSGIIRVIGPWFLSYFSP